MQKVIISGIQQIGIGVSNVHKAWKWYRQYFGMDTPIFEEAAVADLMLPYTGGKPRERHAVLALNLQGGSGMEIWQYTNRIPTAPKFTPQLGDYGIYIAKIQTKDVSATFQYFKQQGLDLLSDICVDPAGNQHFFLKDPYQNIFQVIESQHTFKKGKRLTGGPVGCFIGVSDIDKALSLYKDILGYDEVVYDVTKVCEDFKNLPSGGYKVRRVLLKHSQIRKGAFSRMLGPSEIELLQVFDRTPQKIYQNRFWGDLGFIHLCFDIQGMSNLRANCEANGFPFTVDSRDSFDMGEAAGHFSYIEDPDGTLIEFVETHKIPVMKKIGWYIDLRKRDPEKPLPNWMLKSLSFNRVKD